MKGFLSILIFLVLLFVFCSANASYVMTDYLRDANGTPISGAFARAYERFTNRFLDQDTTDSQGRYDLVISSDVGLVTICVSNYLSGAPSLSRCWDIDSYAHTGEALHAQYSRTAWTAAPFCTTATNLCGNPGFENGGFDSTAAPFDWDTTCTSASGTFTWHSTGGPNGTGDAYCRMTTGTDGACTGGGYTGLSYKIYEPPYGVVIDSTKRIVLSCWFRGTLSQVGLQFNAPDLSDRGSISTGVDCPPVATGMMNWDVGSTWTRLVLVGPSPSTYQVGTTRASPYFDIRVPSDTLDIDDVQLEYATEDSLIPVGGLNWPYKCANHVLPGCENWPGGPMAYWYSWLGSYWNQPTVARDLEYVHGLGINCIRVFGSLDQITTFDDVTGFSSFNQTYVQRLDTFLNEVCEPIGLKVLLVIFNRGGGTECDSLHSQMPWQFQTRALTHDGKYATMRTNYLQMIDSLAIRYASNPVIAGYDIMNEGIGGLANDTVSVQSAIQFFNDCYTHLKAHDTLHPVTVSSTLANSRSFMNLTACTDFYDIHIYRSHPEWVSDNTLNLAGRLKPVIIGETMSSYTYKTNADSLYIGLRNIYQDAWTYGFESVFAWDFSTEDVMMLRNANGTHTLGVGGEFVANFEKRFR